MAENSTKFDLSQLAESALELLLHGTLEGGGPLGDYLADILTNETVRRARAAAGRSQEDPVLLEIPLLKPTQVEAGIADAERTLTSLEHAILASEPSQARELMTAVAFIEAAKAQLQREQAMHDITLN